MKDLRELLEHEVQDLYSAETQWIQALPNLSGTVKNQRLKQTFDQQLDETKRQKERLEKVANLMHIKTRGGTSETMQGLIHDGEKLLKQNGGPEVRDAALISTAQKVEHFQIAGYGTARSYAQMIGNTEIAELLGKCLEEVKSTDHKFTNVAMERVNQGAIA